MTAVAALDRLPERARGILAARVDWALISESPLVGTPSTQLIDFDEFSRFAKSAWGQLGRSEPLQVTLVETLRPSLQQTEFDGVAGTARWMLPPAWAAARFTGDLAGWTGAVPYIDVKLDGLFKVVALHEIAHLLVDTHEVLHGHGICWLDAFDGALRKVLGEAVADMRLGAHYQLLELLNEDD